jgi:hypothetical protein
MGFKAVMLDNTVELQGETGSRCINITGDLSLKVLRRECGSTPPMCVSCNEEFSSEAIGNTLEIPDTIIELFELSNGQNYSTFVNDDGSVSIEFEKDECVVCEKDRTGSYDLIPAKEKYVCEECFQNMRKHRLLR